MQDDCLGQKNTMIYYETQKYHSDDLSTTAKPNHFVNLKKKKSGDMYKKLLCREAILQYFNYPLNCLSLHLSVKN